MGATCIGSATQRFGHRLEGAKMHFSNISNTELLAMFGGGHDENVDGRLDFDSPEGKALARRMAKEFRKAGVKPNCVRWPMQQRTEQAERAPYHTLIGGYETEDDLPEVHSAIMAEVGIHSGMSRGEAQGTWAAVLKKRYPEDWGASGGVEVIIAAEEARSCLRHTPNEPSCKVPRYRSPHAPCCHKKGKVAGFYSALSETIPPLPWPNFAPPFPTTLIM